MRRTSRIILLLLTCIAAGLASCQTSDIREPESNAVPATKWATFDGDRNLASNVEGFHSGYRVSSLDGHDLYDRRHVDLKEDKIRCRLRDCKLHPGQHSISVSYYWRSIEDEKKIRRRTNWQFLGFFLSVISPGQMADPPDFSVSYQCRTSVTFEVQSKHDYTLNIIHKNPSESPNEFQVLDIESGVVVGNARPTC